MMTLFFNTLDKGTITIRGRMEGDNGLVGDFYRELNSGEDIFGITYEDLESHRHGTITLDDEGNPIINPADK